MPETCINTFCTGAGSVACIPSGYPIGAEQFKFRDTEKKGCILS